MRKSLVKFAKSEEGKKIRKSGRGKEIATGGLLQAVLPIKQPTKSSTPPPKPPVTHDKYLADMKEIREKTTRKHLESAEQIHRNKYEQAVQHEADKPSPAEFWRKKKEEMDARLKALNEQNE